MMKILKSQFIGTIQMVMLKEFITGFHYGTKEFASSLATIINVILLSIVYFSSVGITSLLAKVMKKRFLSLKPTTEKSYWVDLNLKKGKTEEYYRQF